jgi:hypothetical protein
LRGLALPSLATAIAWNAAIKPRCMIFP